MQYLSTSDYVIIALYFVILIGMGVYLSRRASRSIEDYFIAGRKMPWWALGISGMTNFIDLAGTSLVISFIFMLGPRGLFIEFRGGVALVLPIMLLWTGKWHYRSRVLTGAEWMTFRFGEGFGGQFARIVSAIAVIVGTIGMLAYSIKGVSLFFSMFLPFPPLLCALFMVGVTTVYTMMSGFYGVVYSNFFQGIVIIIAVVVIIVLASLQVADSTTLGVAAAQASGNAEWTSSVPQWFTTMPRGYEAYQHLAMFAFFYLLKAVFQGMGWGDDPKYFGARSERECGTLTFLWTTLMTFRWPLIIAFAVLGVYVVNGLFPDQTVLMQAAALIKQHLGGVDKSRWADILSGLTNSPETYPPSLIAGLHALLGDGWKSSLMLVSYEGTVNPERIMPAVLVYGIPIGLRGLIIIALLAAEMSTFSGNVNRAAGYFTRDLYQRYLRPHASNRELIAASWLTVVGFVVIAFSFAYTIRSINDVWGWITMSFGSGLLMPAFLRFYWARFNGGGFAVGTIAGMVSAIIQRIFWPGMDELASFLVIGGIGLVGAIIGTYATEPTDRKLLERFYVMTRPFGFWGNMKKLLTPEAQTAMAREHRREILAVPIVMVWQVTMYLAPMQALIRTWSAFGITIALHCASLAAMYVVWYRHLPKEEPVLASLIQDGAAAVEGDRLQ